MQLLFIDESASEPLKSIGRLVALTGLTVPLTAYARARTRFYESFPNHRTEGGLSVNLAPIELHGRKLLPDASNDEKLAALGRVVDLVLQFEFGVYRFGYASSPTLHQFFKRDDVAFSLAWLDMITAVQPELRRGPLIPIADAGNADLAEHMSRSVRNLDVLREAGLGASLSIQETENIVGEVFFGNSRYSVFIQVVDIVSYLLLQRDMKDLGWPVTAFKERVLQVADRLVPAIRHARMANATMQGSTMVLEELGPNCLRRSEG